LRYIYFIVCSFIPLIVEFVLRGPEFELIRHFLIKLALLF